MYNSQFLLFFQPIEQYRMQILSRYFFCLYIFTSFIHFINFSSFIVSSTYFVHVKQERWRLDSCFSSQQEKRQICKAHLEIYRISPFGNWRKSRVKTLIESKDRNTWSRLLWTWNIEVWRSELVRRGETRLASFFKFFISSSYGLIAK